MDFCTNKIFMPLCGKSILQHILDNVHSTGLNDITVVSSQQNYKKIGTMHYVKQVCVQKIANGTGGAVLCTLPSLNLHNKLTLVFNGDGPVLCTEFLHKFLSNFDADLRILTNFASVHSTNGRVLRKNGKIVGLREFKDASELEKQITECNAGVYLFDTQKLCKHITKLTQNNAQHEFYLTDLIEIFNKNNLKIDSVAMDAKNNYLSVNTMHELSIQNEKMQKEIKQNLIKKGVLFVHPNSAYIDACAIVGVHSTIYGGVQILGNTCVGEECIVLPNCVIINSQISPKTTVPAGSVIVDNKHKK